jgi:DNA-binding GntR family transcriptional regulator
MPPSPLDVISDIAENSSQYDIVIFRIKNKTRSLKKVAPSRRRLYTPEDQAGLNNTMNKSTKLPDTTSLEVVPDKIYDTIVAAILDRALDPGAKLPEDVFCAHYGVSRTIVRIAIHRLEQDRLVEVQRNRGCFVAVPDLTEASDILAARKAVEPFIVRSLVEVATDGELQMLRDHVDSENAAYHKGDRREALRLSGQFHLLLGNLVKNKVLEAFLHNLVCRSALVIATYSDVTGSCKSHDHRQLVEFLCKRNAEGAVELMNHHIDHIKRDLLSANPEEEKSSLESILARYSDVPSLKAG